MSGQSELTAAAEYRPRRVPRQERLQVHGARMAVTRWGPDAAPIVLLHGAMDCGASYQLLADALPGDWPLAAVDWRGYGDSEPRRDGYLYVHNLGDLDALLEQLSPGTPARLVGHSLGGNVVMLYAGARPQRVERVVSLEGFGIPAETADVAPDKFAKWLDALKDPPSFRPYRDLAAVADQLQKNNPRLARDKAEFLAAHWAEAHPGGGVRLKSDPRHKLPFPAVYRMEEVLAVWKRIAAPVLWVAASESFIPRWLGAHPEGEAGADGLGEIRARLAQVPRGSLVTIDAAGHMLHLDRPDAVAAAIEPFLSA